MRIEKRLELTGVTVQRGLPERFCGRGWKRCSEVLERLDESCDVRAEWLSFDRRDEGSFVLARKGRPSPI